MNDYDGGHGLLGRRAFLAQSTAVAALAVATPAFAGPVKDIPRSARKAGHIVLCGRAIKYESEAGETVMSLPDGSQGGTIFSVSYVERGTSVATRPVTFIWNGGPGGASFHLRQQLAPRMYERAANDRGFDYRDNVHSLLDVTDLVFIDAPGTGYSRIFSDEAKSAFWGIEGDGAVFAAFITRWVELHNRSSSPLYLMGESYGGTRAGQVAWMLATQTKPLPLEGLILISPGLHGTGAALPQGKRSGAYLVLPSQAATSWYHRKGGYTDQDLETVVAAAEAFAVGPYRAALEMGNRLGDGQRSQIAGELARFTGLPVADILKWDLAISVSDYRNGLLADRGQLLKGNDARVALAKPAPGTTLSVLNTAEGYDLHAAIIGIIGEDLGYRTSAGYQRDPGEIGKRWNSTMAKGTSSVPDILKNLMRDNGKLKLLTLNGYYDFAVVYSYQREALQAAGLPAERSSMHTFECGHAVYEDEESKPHTLDLTRAFYRS